MIATDFISNIDKFKLTKPSVALHDLVDHLNTLGFVILVILSAGSLVGQIVSNPMTCYIPQFPSGINFEGTLQSHCWISGTYNIPGGKFLSTELEWANAWREKGISYYQWIPFILSAMCMLFYIPSLSWSYFCENVPGIDINSVVAIAEGSKSSSGSKRKEMAQQLASLLSNYFVSHRNYTTGSYSKCRETLHRLLRVFFLSKRMGSRILGNYFLVKIIYIVIIGLQLWILSIFFGLDSSTIIGIFRETSENIFPTSTVCHWPNVLGQGQSYNAVCLLSWNIVYKYIFGVLWFFFVGLLAVNVASLFACTWNNISRNHETKIEKLLELMDLRQSPNGHNFTTFQNQFLNNDIVFLLSLLERISGQSMVEEILFCLWQKFESENPQDEEPQQQVSPLLKYGP